ncbi:glycosyltransferase family 4 protein [Brumimicrobium mesophilum]|uniref:glycosyltransferase family 4 protein n=1 Tax=Brumimicrobium mesophilum TaxID=392717 RepID=UPI000D14082B|nr:glycosyltransferase family 4 protein [Brumimicrobium mesophilum]
MKKLIIGITAEGSVNLLLGQLKHFKSLGYKTYVMGPLSDRSAAFCKNEGCEHLIINIEREISPIKDFKTLLQIRKIFKEVQPDIINFGTPKVSLLGMIAGAMVGVKKRIYTCRGFRFEHETGVKRRILISMEKITSSLAHKVICISNSVLELGLKNNIFKKEKTIITHKGSSNGVNLDLFNPDIKKYQDVKDSLIKEYNLEDAFVFGFLGRIVDRKGINELYEVFSKIYNSNPKTKLFIVGPFEMTQIKDKTLVDKINNHPGIINYGRILQDEVPPFMMIMDVFVLPAWWEGFGNVLVQASAMGVPVISTTGTGTVDAVSNGYNGILIPVKDEVKLQEAMESMLNNENQRITYSQNGPIWAKNFNRETIWEQLDHVYKN